MKHTLSLFFLLATLASFAQSISVQGVLRDPKGRTVEDGTYQVTFALYDQLTGGSALYAETHPNVETSQGLFAARLGSVWGRDTLSYLAFDTTYYLGISIEGTAELEPRTELTLNPYVKSVRGGDNQFPSTGNVNIKTDFTIDLGNVYLGEGDVLLAKGGLTLDSGMITISLGDIMLTDAGGAIRFADGTILNSAEGGTASSAANIDTLSVRADADMDSTGGIEFQIGIQPVMTMRNDGLVTMEAGMKLDSGKIMYKGNCDIALGHYNPADSSFTTQVTMAADSTVTFARIPQSLDTAQADDDVFTLGYLKNVVEEKLTQDVRQTTSLNIGDTYGGGTVFAVEEDYVYIAYQYSGTRYLSASNIDAVTGTSPDFGTGYQNTELILALIGSSNSSYLTYYLRNGNYGGFNDWYIPSRAELLRVYQELPAFANASSSFTGTSTSGYTGNGTGACGTSGNTWVDVHNSSSTSCYSPTTNSMNWVFVRREPVGYLYDTSDPDDYVTAGVLQNNRSAFTADTAPRIGDVMGEGNDQGTVFAVIGNQIYLAKYISSYYYLGNSGNSFTTWNSSEEFGTGYNNTQSLFNASTTTLSSYLEYLITNNYENWYIPSHDELKMVLDSIPSIAPTYTYLWTSSKGSCYNDDGQYIYTNGSGGYSSVNCRDANSYSHRVILIRSISRESNATYDADNSNLVTWAFLNQKIADLELKIDAAAYNLSQQTYLNNYQIGDQVEGGTVFAIDGGYAYIAYEYNINNQYRYYDYTSSASGTAIGTGYDNTQYILNAASTTSTSYIEGILRSTVNGYSDWFMPSRDELQAVFDNTSVATNTYDYYWSSTYSGCCGDYEMNAPGYSQGDSYYNDYYYLILVRRVPTN